MSAPQDTALCPGTFKFLPICIPDAQHRTGQSRCPAYGCSMDEHTNPPGQICSCSRLAQSLALLRGHLFPSPGFPSTWRDMCKCDTRSFSPPGQPLSPRGGAAMYLIAEFGRRSWACLALLLPPLLRGVSCCSLLSTSNCAPPEQDSPCPVRP